MFDLTIKVSAMKDYLWLFVIFIFSLSILSAQEGSLSIPVKKVLSKGETISIKFDNKKITRLELNFQNIIDEESVVYWSEFLDGKERLESEMGPKFIRTKTLRPKTKDEGNPVKLDRKTIVLDTSGMNEIYLKVEKGSVEIEIKEEKRKI